VKKTQNFFSRFPTLISSSGILLAKFNEESESVAHFENTMAIDLEILLDSKIKIQNTPKWYIII
jgi:hypothetical protein